MWDLPETGGQAFHLSESPTAAPALPLHPHCERASSMSRELMAQKDFTEIPAEIDVPDRTFFFLFRSIFSFSKVSAF